MFCAACRFHCRFVVLAFCLLVNGRTGADAPTRTIAPPPGDLLKKGVASLLREISASLPKGARLSRVSVTASEMEVLLWETVPPPPKGDRTPRRIAGWRYAYRDGHLIGPTPISVQTPAPHETSALSDARVDRLVQIVRACEQKVRGQVVEAIWGGGDRPAMPWSLRADVQGKTLWCRVSVFGKVEDIGP